MLDEALVRLRTSSSPPERWPEALADLRRWHAGAGPVNYVGGPGDSIAEGYGASSRSAGWWSVFGAAMASGLGRRSPSVGSAEVSCAGVWPIWDHQGPPPTEFGIGLGLYSSLLYPGTVLSTTQPCDRLQVLYSRTHFLHGWRGGELQIRIDHRPAATLDCGSDVDLVGVLWDSGPLASRGSHTIELECTAGEGALVDHVYLHDGDDGTGPLFWRNGHLGATVGTGPYGFAERQSPWMGPFTSTELLPNPACGHPVHGAGSIEAHCFLLSTGTNDITAFENDRYRITSAYADMIGYLRDRCSTPASIGIVVPTSSSRCDGDYGQLLAAVTDVCRSEEAFLIDLWTDLGTHADDSCGFYLDGIHPNDRGHSAWGEYVAAWMLAAIGAESA